MAPACERIGALVVGQVIDEPDAPDPCACAAQAGLIELLDRIVGGLDHRCGGLRSTRMRILRQVVGAGRRGAFQTDLADRLHVSHPAMSKICDELERESLVRRQPPPFDRRKKAVLLTDKGEAQVHTCASALNEAGAAATAALTAAELLTLERLLEKVEAGLSTFHGASDCADCQIGGCA